MNFCNIIGQENVIESLKASLTADRIGHAYIFSGPRGIGKRTVAGIFAGFLLCDAPTPDGTCGVCQACRLYEGGSNPDFYIIRVEGSSIGVDEIRDLQGDVAIKPLYSKRKVYVIEDADKMTAQAQNCLLKTLEEPPSHVVIILTASNYGALLETVRSRSQRTDFKKNTHAQVRQALLQKFGTTFEGMDFAAAYANGVIGTALELAGEGDFLSTREKIFKILSQIHKTDLIELFEKFSFLDDEKDNVDMILDMMELYYRDLLVAREAGNENMLINSDKKDIIFNNVPAYRSGKLVSNIEQIEAARRAIKQNANYQLAVECMLIKLQEE